MRESQRHYSIERSQTQRVHILPSSICMKLNPNHRGGASGSWEEEGGGSQAMEASLSVSYKSEAMCRNSQNCPYNLDNFYANWIPITNNRSDNDIRPAEAFVERSGRTGRVSW